MTPRIGSGSKAEGIEVTPEMCAACFDFLLHELGRGERPKLNTTVPNEEYALFVTWKKGRDRALRGCIGTFRPLPLHEGLKEYSITAALRDSRFRPVKAEEVHQLEVAISLLHSFEDGENWEDWEVGKHGIWIEFGQPGSTRTATYLPEVMPEQGWTKEEALHSLLRKGGFRGSIDKSVLRGVKLTRYQSAKGSLHYDDYAGA
eukprot:Clim_evm30s207 gene=Clim_evmTU30s207